MDLFCLQLLEQVPQVSPGERHCPLHESWARGPPRAVEVGESWLWDNMGQGASVSDRAEETWRGIWMAFVSQLCFRTGGSALPIGVKQNQTGPELSWS